MEPRRSFLTLAALVVLPALALGGIAAAARAFEVDIPVMPATVSGGTIPVVASTPLLTPLLSVRRSPGSLALAKRQQVLTSALNDLAVSVDAESCMAVGVNGRLLTGTNTANSVIPASNLKVVVAEAALAVLGPTAVFTTQVLGPAPLNGVVQGDIHLVGGGDPVLSEQWYTRSTATHKRPPINTTSIEALADALVANGVQAIEGSVLGDDSRYDDERHPPGWSESIIATPDGTAVGALVVNDSTTAAGAISPDPTLSAAAVFARLLRARGVTVGGDVGVGVAAATDVPLASVNSQPLPAILNEMLATSDNLTAEMMVKEIGRTVGGAGTRSAGLSAISQQLVAWGIPLEGVNLVDGSGLSRENRLTCTSLLAVLQRGHADDPVGAGMARAGQDGSTLDDRFEDAGLIDVLQAKTGSLRGVKALCGYFPAGGDEIAFVLVLNGPSATAFESRWDLLGAALLAAASAPSADSLGPRAS
jgi:D-alanyl-D-alanine carboxypeptidase/D-alanyl-D-alanine-endopeptidase (penicillin-binding protein 4)